MEIRQLKYFLKVAETLNFSEASRSLFVTQSTLSQQILKLEQELDMQLFERNSHEVTLTEAGCHLRRYAERAVNAVDDCTQHLEDLKDMLAGELNIGVTFSFHSIAHEALMTFLKRYPRVRLNVCYKPMSELLDMLKRRKLDIVLAFKPSKADDRIESRRLFVNRLAVIARDSHPLMRRQKIGLESLADYSLVLPAHGLQARNVLDRLLTAYDIRLNSCVEINNVNQLLGIIRESNYVTVLSESTIIAEPTLKSVPLDCDGGTMEGCVHILRDSYVKRAATEFMAMLGDSIAVQRLI